MRHLWIFILVLAMFLAGCGGLKDKVVGTWKVDTNSIKGAAFDQLKAQPGFADQLVKALGSERFEFKSDGTVNFSGPTGPSMSGKWTIDGNNLKVTPDNAKDNSGAPTMTVSSDGSKIHMSGGNGPTAGEMDLVKA